MDNSILAWMLVVPAVAGLIAFLWPRRLNRPMHIFMLLVAVWLLITAIRMQFYSNLHWCKPWLDLGFVTLSLNLMATRFGTIIVLFISFFGVLLSLYVTAYTRSHVGRHHAYMLWTLTGAIGAALANDFIFLLICWEITTVMLFLLINQAGPQAKSGAAKTFALLGFSDCALLLGVALLLFTNPQPSLTMNQFHLTTNSPISVFAFLLFTTAALAKAGAMPFHTWIPAAAEGASCDVMAFLPASLDKLLGIYLLGRTCLEFFTITPSLKMLLMIIGAVTIMGAVMMAVIQHNLKKLLSFHAISQVGYMVLGIGTGSVIGIAGGIFHMINHSIYKSCLFLSAGSVEKQTGHTDLEKLGGLAKVMPLSFFACVISALAISGVPPLNGFSSKWMIYQAVLDVPSRLAPILVAAALFGSALTLASFIKVIHGVFLGSKPEHLQKKTISESPYWMTTPMVILALLCILFGIFAIVPLSWFVVPAMETLRVPGLADHLQAGNITALKTLWNPALATGLMVIALLFGIIIFAIGKGFRIRHTQSYIGGEKRLPVPDTTHYSGVSFYTTISDLPGIKSMYRDAERSTFDIYRIGGQLGQTLVDALRRCQTGVLSLYLSWVILGLVLILVYLIGVGAG